MTLVRRSSVIVNRAGLRLLLRPVQTMGMPAMRHRWTTTDVRALIADSPAHWPRYELIDGELIVTPAPAPVHQIAVSELLALLIPYVYHEQIGIALSSPSDLELRNESIIQPDLFVAPLERSTLSDPDPGWGSVTALVLAVEIISPCSMHSDRVDKRNYYLDAGVPDYWVVDLDARVVEWWSPERESPTVLRSTVQWHPAAARAPLAIDLPALFERIWSKSRRLGGP